MLFAKKYKTFEEMNKIYNMHFEAKETNRYHKNSFGFDEYQVEFLTSIKRFWSMVLMTYTFLELFRVSNKKSLRLENLGYTIRYFRNQYLVNIAKFAYACAVNGVELCTVVSKLQSAA